MLRQALALVLFLSALALRGGGFAPIPAEDWAVKEEPARGIQGAVVLEKRLRFDKMGLVYYYRLRILSEAGKRLANFRPPARAHGFEGRTVQRDGRELTFQDDKDFTTTTLSTWSGFERQETVVFPPGLTSDCILELTFRSSGNRVVGTRFSANLPGGGLAVRMGLRVPPLHPEVGGGNPA